MLSPIECELLDSLIKEIRRSNMKAEMYSRFLERLLDSLSDMQHIQENTSSFTDLEVERLMKLNRRLGEIELLIRDTERELRPRLLDKISNHDDPMGDFEIDAKFDFILRDDDPEASADSDNILTTREVFFSLDETDDKEIIDFRESGNSETKQLSAEPHCHLFHDITEHSYGIEQPRIPLRDCLRIGSVWVEVIVRQQYFLDLETGEWDKADGERKLVASSKISSE